MFTKLVLVLKKKESEDKTKYDMFYWHSNFETIINGSDIMIIYLSQSILQLYQTYKNV